MTKTILIFTAALAITVAALPAQTGEGAGRSGFQQAGVMGRSGTPAPTMAGGRGAPQQVVVVGKPLSATEERKTTQTLADGTLLENADTNRFFRDSEGRTRVEQTVQGTTIRIIRIVDPVAHVTVLLDPAAKTAQKNGSLLTPRPTTSIAMPSGGAGAQGGRGGTMPPDVLFAQGQAAGRAAAVATPRPNSEDLGVQIQNGVAAQGTRDTQIIPAGKIGNNRDIHVVYERWYSNDLQMLVKSSNSDPRFGVTTYQLTNIVQGAPDPGLFQIPADYTVRENGQ
jgi:hypothetical protein